jgi:hypothetical protein
VQCVFCKACVEGREHLFLCGLSKHIWRKILENCLIVDMQES